MTIRVRFHPSVAPPPELVPFPGEMLARLMMNEAGAGEGEVHCVLTGDAELADLNRRFRGKDGPTDVLAFPYDPARSDGVLGDVFVSLERAAAQAGDRGEPLAREVWRLFVHGVLHLAGHDHDTPDSEREMMELQEDWVSRLRLHGRVDGL